MNIARLDLLAFGPFDNRVLNFDSSQPGLHLVYGPNEAGKSTCLRAIRYWLFGIPNRCADDFLHGTSKLQLGGKLMNSGGDALEFVRRKGRKDTLRAVSDAAVLPESALRPFLQGVDVTTFHQRFHLDHEELVKGGQALGSSSEVTEVLFAAGAGIADIRAIQTQLQAQWRGLFLPTGNNPTLNVLIKQHQDLRARQREVGLAAADWTAMEQQLQAAQQTRASLEAQLRAARRQRLYWERLRRAFPLVESLRGQQMVVSQLRDAPSLPAEFRERRIQAMTNVQSTERAAADAETRVKQLREKVDSTQLPGELLELKPAIASLYSRLGEMQKSEHDRRRLTAERRGFVEQIAELRQQLAEFGQPSDWETWQLTSRQRQQLQTLANQYVAWVDRQQQWDDARRETTRAWEKVQRELAERENRETIPEPAELRKRIGPMVASSAVEKAWKELEQKRILAEQQLTSLIDTLPLFQGSIDQWTALPVPLLETVEERGLELARRERERDVAHQQWQLQVDQVQRLEQEHESFMATQQVPTEAELRQLRDQRDQTLRDAWGTRGADAGEATFQAGWQLLQAADQMVDRLRREADRVAQYARLAVDLQQAQIGLQRCQTELTAKESQLAQWQSEWRALWRPCGLEPLSPREMLSWLRRHQEVLRLASEVRRWQVEWVALEPQVREARYKVEQFLLACRAVPPRDSESLPDLLHRCELELERIDRAWQETTKLEQKRDQLLVEQERQAEQIDQLRAAQLQWTTQWATVLQEAQLRADVLPIDLPKLWEAYDQWRQLQKSAEDRKRRIDGMQRDEDLFKQDVDRLRGLETRLADLPADEVVRLLFEHATQAEQVRTRLEQWQQQWETAQAQWQTHQRDSQHWQAELAELCRLATCHDPAELPRLEAQGLQRAEAEREIVNLQMQLAQLADGVTMEDLLQAVADCQPDEVVWQLEQTQRQIETLEQQVAEQAETIGRLKRELEQLDGNAVAAQLEEDVREVAAAIEQHARQYIRLRLATGILDRVMEQYRQANQGGVLGRASELFAQLTLNSFAGLQVEMEGDGSFHLMGLRPDGLTTVPTSGLSEGTRDQMYLAVRVALLESYLEQNPPLPLLVDDLLITFDDQRSVAALQVLSRLAQHTQVIFFTHHLRLVELAQQALPPQTFSLQTLETTTSHNA